MFESPVRQPGVFKRVSPHWTGQGPQEPDARSRIAQMMPDCDRLQDYAALLHTRHKAARRDATLTGAVFFLTMLAFVASGLLGELGGPSEYLMLAIITVLALAYLTAWVRFHTTKVVIDLVDALRREGMRR